MKTLLLLGISICLPAFGFGYADLRQVIEDRHLTSVESALHALPPEFSANYALLRTSLSQQAASAEAPRVIRFSADGNLLLAHNGDSHHVGFDTLETIQFHPESATYEFHRVHFPGAGQAPEFSAANPAECTVCHSSSLRPNWEQYATWPGAYGEEDDFPKAPELTALKNFFSWSMSSERYRDLVRLPGSEAAPYETVDRGRLRFRPNFRLSAITFAQQADALSARLARHPRFREFRALFVMSRLQCAELKDPAAELTRLFGADAVRPFPPMEPLSATNAYAYLLRALGISAREWTTRFGAPDEKMDPYFFHCGVPRGLELGPGPDDGGEQKVLELSDFVAARLVDKMAEAQPALRPFQRRYRWVEKRFEKDAADRELATALDDALGVFDYSVLKGACGILQQELNRSGASASYSARARGLSASR